MPVTDDKALRLIKRAQSLWAKRKAVFDSPCQEIANYYWPDVSDINTEKTEGTIDWFQNVYESTAIRAAATCSVGVRNWVTPSTDPWLGLEPPRVARNRTRTRGAFGGKQDRNARPTRTSRLRQPPQQQDEGDDGQDDATKWCGGSGDEAQSALSGSNFYSVIQPFNRGACTFGTSLMYCEEGKAETLRFEQFKFGTYCIAENDQKQVDTVFRWFKLTNRQAAQKWGKEKLPPRIQKILDKKPDEMNTYIHHVAPNDEQKAGALGARGMAVYSCYLSEQDKMIIEEGGYEEMPYFALRWARWGTEDQVYGCSPAFETLPEARQLNYITQFGDALVELQAFPRFLYPDNLTGEVQLAPGGVTPVKADAMARGEVPKEWMTMGKMESLDEMVQKKVKAIEDAFFVGIFTMLGQLQDKRMTAMEVAQRVGEKLDQFTGTFDQYVTDLINPLVRRVLGILARGGHLEEPPESLMVNESADPKSPKVLAAPKVVIQSRVTLSIKALRNTGMQNTIQTLQPLVEAQAQNGSPDQILDNFDLDEFSREVARNFGVNDSVLRKVKDVLAIRDQRKQMVAQERALQQAKTASEAGKNLGKAPQPIQDQVTQRVTGGDQQNAA